MDKILLEDFNDVIKREKLFKKHAMKYLQSLTILRPDSSYKSDFLRTQKELDDLEKEYTEVDTRKVVKKKKVSVEEEDDDLEYEVELSRKERRMKNKKKYPDFLTKGKKKREMKSRKKSRRRRRN